MSGLDNATPEQLRAEISRLRDENAKRRQEAATYRDAFSGLPEDEQRGLLHLVTVFTENPSAGAELFRELADSVLGTQDSKEGTEMTEKDSALPVTGLTQDSAPAALPPEVLQMVESLQQEVEQLKAEREQMTQAQEAEGVAQLEEWLDQHGYSPGTPDREEFLVMAEMAKGNLELADRMYRQLPKDQVEGEPPVEGEQPAPEAAPPTPEFPVTAAAGTTGGPHLDAKAQGDELDYNDKEAVNVAALKYLEGLQQASTT